MPSRHQQRARVLCKCCKCGVQGRWVPRSTRQSHTARRPPASLFDHSSDDDSGSTDSSQDTTCTSDDLSIVSDGPHPVADDPDLTDTSASSTSSSDADTTDSEHDDSVANAHNLLMFCREMLEVTNTMNVSKRAMECILQITRNRLGPMLPAVAQVDLPKTFHMLKKRAGGVRVRNTKPTLCDDCKCNAVVSPYDGSQTCGTCGNQLYNAHGAPLMRMLEFDLLGLIRDMWASPTLAAAMHQLGNRQPGTLTQSGMLSELSVNVTSGRV